MVCHVILSRYFFLFIIYCLNVKNFKDFVVASIFSEASVEVS